MQNKGEEISRSLAEAIRRCHQARSKGRAQIAAELNARLGLPWKAPGGELIRREITLADLNELTRSRLPGRGASVPAEWVADLCEVLGDEDLARSLLTDRLQKVLAVGELAIKSRGTLVCALAELQKIVEPPARRKSGASKSGETAKGAMHGNTGKGGSAER